MVNGKSRPEEMSGELTFSYFATSEAGATTMSSRLNGLQYEECHVVDVVDVRQWI